MARRHVECLEVVPIGLDLRAFGNLESEADEDVLESLPGLGNQMGMTTTRRTLVLGEIESLGGQTGRSLGCCERRTTFGDGAGEGDDEAASAGEPLSKMIETVAAAAKTLLIVNTSSRYPAKGGRKPK